MILKTIVFQRNAAISEKMWFIMMIATVTTVPSQEQIN